MAFQLVDDMLDYTISSEELGKPGGADLELGLATAPLLFAWKENPTLGKLVGRKFGEKGDAQKVSHHNKSVDRRDETGNGRISRLTHHRLATSSSQAQASSKPAP